MSSSNSYDVAVVGAGILGLTHAFHLARQGRRVIVFERGLRAQGASVRNFGMLWPIGQPAGHMHELALASRELWLEALRAADVWHDPVGSLHLAYHEDEAQVLAEFFARSGADGYDCELLLPDGVSRRAPAVKTKGLLAGLFSPTEICVDPREVIARFPGWLEREYDVRFEFATTVTQFERPQLIASQRSYNVQRLVVCSGEDLQTLYPKTLSAAGLLRCKLQMMRTQPRLARLRPMLAGGLTLRHYKNFESCPTLETVKARIARDNPEFDRYGIHVLVSQNGHGELILGDSHEYDSAIEPFDKAEIDNLVLNYLDTFFDRGDLAIAARWHGIYAKHPRESYFVAQPAPGATVVTGVGGNGMTLSFGLAGEVVRNLER
jgi:D-hydroxyproline dehydrogenase subunit beta